MAGLLALKARVELAEGGHEEAIRSIETGLAMARHLAEAPFLIVHMIGIAVANQFIDRIVELASRPDAPNLCWALSALPRPLIDTRNAMETEQALGEWIVSEVAGLDRIRSEGEWESRLALLHERLLRIDQDLAGSEPDRGNPIPAQIEEFRSEYLPRARAFFNGQGTR